MTEDDCPYSSSRKVVERNLTPALLPQLPLEGRFDPGPISVRPATMLRIQGYRQPDSAPSAIAGIAERMAACAQELFAPVIQYLVVPLSRAEGSLRVLDRIPIRPGAEGEVMLARSVTLVIVLLTLGGRFDEKAERLRSRGEMVDALFLETAGWLGIEVATKAFATWLRAWGRKYGYALTRRLAPGYATWPLTGQHELFAAFGAARLPVRLLESCAMTPKMSRSGVYGLVTSSVPDPLAGDAHLREESNDV